MISSQHVMPLLLEACPGFRPKWDEHLAWWNGKEPGLYNDTGEFAAYLRDRFVAGDTSEFPAAFAVIEQLVIDGDAEVRDLAVIGILESLQNLASHRAFGYEVFETWLGPRSMDGWRELEGLWVAKESLMDVFRARKADDR